MPRFVLLYHDCPPDYVKPSHWDFMLEANGVLCTWELRALPGTWLAALDTTSQAWRAVSRPTPTTSWCPVGARDRSVPAQRLADHRLDYLDYEGPLSNDRGSVIRIASGEYEMLDETPQALVVRLNSETINGVVELAETSQLSHWQLTVRE